MICSSISFLLFFIHTHCFQYDPGFAGVGLSQRTKIIVFIAILTQTVYKESWKFVPIIINNNEERHLLYVSSSFRFFLGSSKVGTNARLLIFIFRSS